MKQLLCITLYLITLSFFGQDTDEPVKIQFDLHPDMAGMNSTSREFIVDGSPYLNETYQLGTIINGNNKSEALLRYNVFEDKFQFLDENKKKKFLLKAPNIKVILDGKTYEIVEFKEAPKYNLGYYVPKTEKNKNTNNTKMGYFIVLYEGNTILYQKTAKKITKLQQPESGYETFKPSKFVLDKGYYLKKAFKTAYRIDLSKKAMLLALNNKYDEIRVYIKKHKLKVKTEEEVIQVITYYDTLN